jgi:phosphate transport system substrate-binding protein
LIKNYLKIAKNNQDTFYLKNYKLQIMNKIIKQGTVALSLSTVIFAANARDHIEVVGSSTVFPFSTVVAETFGKKTGLPTPKIEATGSGGGMKLFCVGNGINTPDITNASRRIKSSELKQCHNNGVKDITEVLVGFDGIAIANSLSGANFDALTTKDLYLALAAKVPAKALNKGDKNSKQLIDNPFKKWSEINKNLPSVAIKVLGPPPTSGTRDALQELALEGGCKKFPFMKAMKKANKKQYKGLCRTVREDGVYVEMGENDNLIIQKLVNDKNSLGIFGFSFLDQNADKVRGANINGKEITFENIASGAYPISRPLYFYVKNSHREKVQGLNKFIAEFVDEDTFGEEGYLVDKGLIPSPEETREKFMEDAKNSVNLNL